jgi:hypothetical protein
MRAKVAEKASDEAAVRSLFRLNEDEASARTIQSFFPKSTGLFIMFDLHKCAGWRVSRRYRQAGPLDAYPFDTVGNNYRYLPEK